MKKYIAIISFIFCLNAHAQVAGTWVENTTHAMLVLGADGSFQYSGTDGQFQGTYGIQGNIFSMQDYYNNTLQYSIQTYTDNQLVLMDQNGAYYNFQRQGTAQINLPWDDAKFDKALATKGNNSWKERETQIYVSFIQLLIGKKLTVAEMNQIRKSNITDFNENPQVIKNDVQQTENAMKQIFSFNSPDAVAYFREELIATLYQSVQQNPELNNSPLMSIYNQHVQILQYDPTSRLSLSNQDVEAYIQYLQFQNMLMGQSYNVSKQEAEMLQMQLVNGFNALELTQKQSIAYASFIWDVVEQQWSGLTAEQQQQYIAQVQSQMNVQNTTVSPQQVDQSMNTSQDYSADIQALVDKSKAEAAAKGMSVQEYINYKQRELNANSNMFNMMQNSMTENHATMMNVINNLGGGDDSYYYVDYSGY